MQPRRVRRDPRVRRAREDQGKRPAPSRELPAGRGALRCISLPTRGRVGISGRDAAVRGPGFHVSVDCVWEFHAAFEALQYSHESQAFFYRRRVSP